MQLLASPSVSVLMPTYQQARFIRRAFDSLLAQTLTDWEAIIVDDGSRDGTAQAVLPFLNDSRIRFHKLSGNMGLDKALNEGLVRASGQLVAYLPSDDVYYYDHLASLKACLVTNSQVVLAYSGMRRYYSRQTSGQIPGYPLQLVQCMHRKTTVFWTERHELESDDLERLYWAKLRPLGIFAASNRVSCEWADHPVQRHKLMQEPVGGINPFRNYYRVTEPLHFHTSVGNDIDEERQYHHLRERPDTPLADNGLKILLVGELAYNADRVLALEEQGHKLYGLWMQNPYWYNSVGPLPFGHVEDLPQDN